MSGVLERAMPPKPAAAPEPPDDAEAVEQDQEAGGRGRGAAPRKGKATAAATSARKVKGRTIYLPEDLFERIMVQSHRRNKTISEYVTMILDRQVPDYRTVRGDTADEG